MSETNSREILARLYFAATAASRGYDSILGSQSAIRGFASQGLPGVFIENGLNYERTSRLEHLKHRGFSIFSLCEESTAYVNGQAYCDERLDLSAADSIVKIFLLGPDIYNWACQFRPSLLKKSIIIGNPRFDLLRPGIRRIFNRAAFEAAILHGRYILVNTNFGCNPHPLELIHGGYEGFIRAFAGSDEVINARRRLSDYEADIMRFFMRELPSVASNISKQIILRPHPKENVSTWLDWAKTHKHISVDASGDVRGWIQGSHEVIHNNCTTAIESFLLGKKPIHFGPRSHANTEFARTLSNNISTQCFDSAELIHECSIIARDSPAHSFWERAHLVSKRILIDPKYPSSILLIDAISSSLEASDLQTFSCSDIETSARTYIRGFTPPQDGLSLQQMPGIPYRQLAHTLRVWKESGFIDPSVFIVPISSFCCIVRQS